MSQKFNDLKLSLLEKIIPFNSEHLVALEKTPNNYDTLRIIGLCVKFVIWLKYLTLAKKNCNRPHSFETTMFKV